VKAGSTHTVRITLLRAPAGADTSVSVFSTNAAVATATTSNVAAGQQTTDVEITALIDGIATIILRVGNDVRGLTVFVGTPPAGSTPLLLASPVGLSLSALPTLGRMFAPLGAVRTIGVRLFDAPVASDTLVTVTTSDANVATISGQVMVLRGDQIADVPLITRSGGTATGGCSASSGIRARRRSAFRCWMQRRSLRPS
jgi:hypothetical protein